MTVFQGFGEGKVRFTPIPGPFFSELLPLIDDLNELKVLLYALWRLDQMEGSFRYLRPSDFMDDKILMQGMGEDPQSGQENLNLGLEKCVERGSLLKAVMNIEGREEVFYFLNTARGRAAIKAIASGKWQPSGNPVAPIDLTMEQPNVFRMYEEHIGPITPMIAEALREVESTYEPTWVEKAFRIAVENNVRRLSYIQGILRRWLDEGPDERKDRQDPEKDTQRYIDEEFRRRFGR